MTNWNLTIKNSFINPFATFFFQKEFFTVNAEVGTVQTINNSFSRLPYWISSFFVYLGFFLLYIFSFNSRKSCQWFLFINFKFTNFSISFPNAEIFVVKLLFWNRNKTNEKFYRCHCWVKIMNNWNLNDAKEENFSILFALC